MERRRPSDRLVLKIWRGITICGHLQSLIRGRYFEGFVILSRALILVSILLMIRTSLAFSLDLCWRMNTATWYLLLINRHPTVNIIFSAFLALHLIPSSQFCFDTTSSGKMVACIALLSAWLNPGLVWENVICFPRLARASKIPAVPTTIELLNGGGKVQVIHHTWPVFQWSDDSQNRREFAVPSCSSHNLVLKTSSILLVLTHSSRSLAIIVLFPPGLCLISAKFCSWISAMMFFIGLASLTDCTIANIDGVWSFLNKVWMRLTGQNWLQTWTVRHGAQKHPHAGKTW